MEIIIKIEKDKIFFNLYHSISSNNTNIPVGNMSFKYQDGIYWKIELIEYNNETQCWNVKVQDYNVKDISSFSKQRSTKPIEKLNFEKLDWKKLEPQLMSYKPMSINAILLNYPTDTLKQKDESDINIEKHIQYEISRIDTNLIPIASTPQVELEIQSKIPLKDTINVPFSIGFEDITFNNGYVSFAKFIKQIRRRIDFEIKNDYVLKEFDNVKGWFSKRLKVNRIKVLAEIVLLDGQVIDIKASSEHIDMITPELIESIKQQRTLELTKPPKSRSNDKSIFTSEEIFNLLDHTYQEGNVFNQADNEIINILAISKNSRNRIQLEYLAQARQTTNSKIRYTLNPLFGFLFTVEGTENYHFVWELLDSHATYIWSIERTDKEIDILFKSIEEFINKIREIGRDEYKKAYRKSKDMGFTFNVIDHDIITKSTNMGFIKWQTKLNELLE